MNRMIPLALLAALATGCATTSSVKEEMAPLANRVTALEQQDAAMNAKLADLLKKADQKSAADAEAAAVRAETAAAKAAKAFELRQMKGAK